MFLIKRGSSIGLAGALMVLLSGSVLAGEVDYGQGTFSVEGGFLGLKDKATDKVSIYSLKQLHQNLFDSRFYYRYRVSFIDSKEAVSAQSTFNNQSNSWLGNTPTLKVPSIDYRLQGLDGNVSLGYDVIHQDERNFLGLGLLLGISAPWMDSKKSSNSNNNNIPTSIPDSKTEFWSYKVGPQLVARKSLGNYFSVYGSVAYAYQTAHIKNTKLNVSDDVNGHYAGYDIGVRFQPYSEDYHVMGLTLSQRFYVNLGVRQNFWSLEDVQIDVTGQNLPVPKSTLNFETATTYLGVGYQLF